MQVTDKVPPQATDLEQAVLGTILMYDGIFSVANEILNPDSFYREDHKEIFSAMVALDSKSEPIDALTMMRKLPNRVQLIKTLLRYDAPSALEFNCKIIQQKAIQREAINLLQKERDAMYDESCDPFDNIDRACEGLLAMVNHNTDGARHITDCFVDVRKIIDKNILNENTITGIPTGFSKFDYFSRGLQRGDLVIVAGETSQGKTSLSLNIASHAATKGYNVSIFSYEMTANQITARMLSQATGVPSKRILMEKLSKEEIDKLNTKSAKLLDSNVLIDDVDSSDYPYLSKQIKAHKNKFKTDLFIVDYLQLIRFGGKEKRVAVGDVANELKNLAKRLNVVIILVSQLRRDPNSPEPTMGRLKESGDIENAADIVWLTWRPRFYGKDIIEIDGSQVMTESFGGTEEIHLSEQRIAKGRNIGVMEFYLEYHPQLTSFANLRKEMFV